MGHESEKALKEQDKRREKKAEAMPWEKKREAGLRELWDDVDALLIAYVVRAVGGAGGSAQFTTTQDGGSLGLRIYHDGHNTKTTWWRIGEGLEEAMFAIGDYYMEQQGKEKLRWD